MIIAQGWKDKKVNALVLSRCKNGMDGWQVYRGIYDPAAGGTFETAQWECLGSSHNIVDMIYYIVFSEMTSWLDGDKQVVPLQEICIALHAQAKIIADHFRKQP